jgi:hypothetical protein
VGGGVARRARGLRSQPNAVEPHAPMPGGACELCGASDSTLA